MNYSISAEIISGYKTGNIFLIPRIDLTFSKNEIPFELKRRKFPLRLGYAMTINKSQGQYLYLPNPVFSPGQLYLALSRVTSKKNLKSLLADNSKFHN